MAGLAKKMGRRDGRYQTRDPVLAAVLLADGLELLRSEREDNVVVFTFRTRPGLAKRLREIAKVAREAERAGIEIKAQIDAALAMPSV
jgi:hypothetical protein